MIDYVQRSGWRGHILTNTDRVIAAVPLSPGAILRSLKVDVRIWALEQAALFVVRYGAAGMLVPITDPDNAETFQALWDRTVPKNLALTAGGMDLDTGSEVITPEWEPGQLNVEALFDWDNQTRELYRRRKTLTFADGGSGPAATGTMTHFIPRDSFTANVKVGGRAKGPMAAMVAISSPVLASTRATEVVIPTEKQWMMNMFMKDTALNALKSVIGLTEAGATTPYVDAMTYLDSLLSDTPFEETATHMATTTWEVMSSWEAVVSVPGELEMDRLDAEG